MDLLCVHLQRSARNDMSGPLVGYLSYSGQFIIGFDVSFMMKGSSVDLDILFTRPPMFLNRPLRRSRNIVVLLGKSCNEGGGKWKEKRKKEKTQITILIVNSFEIRHGVGFVSCGWRLDTSDVPRDGTSAGRNRTGRACKKDKTKIATQNLHTFLNNYQRAFGETGRDGTSRFVPWDITA